MSSFLQRHKSTEKAIKGLIGPLVFALVFTGPIILILSLLYLIVNYSLLLEFIAIFLTLSLIWSIRQVNVKSSRLRKLSELEKRNMDLISEDERMEIEHKTHFLANRFHGWA